MYNGREKGQGSGAGRQERKTKVRKVRNTEAKEEKKNNTRRTKTGRKIKLRGEIQERCNTV